MEVQLYVYDLSNGIAKAFSKPLMGVQIDAVYHTSIVMEGVEYVYDGGIKMVEPGRTHLGPPLEVLPLGNTELPIDVILEYLESLREIYTMEAYDVFTHNCNNFSNDLSTFLLGKGIPDHIANLPQTVLNTPFGRAIQPEIQRMVARNRPEVGGTGGLLGIQDDTRMMPKHKSRVLKAASKVELDKYLQAAEKSCAIIFFTSETCGPCRAIYPLYEELALAAGHKAVFMKVDISSAYNIGTAYSVRSTPTFVTFLHGVHENRWSGAAPATLRGNVDMLLQMAWPPHPHTSLKLPTFRAANTKPVLYSKVPPLGKLKAKMGPSVADDAAVLSVLNFVSTRASAGAAEATLPDLNAFSRFVRSSPSKLAPETLFTLVDLLRVALVDPRFSGYYAEEKHHATIAPLISHINNLTPCPYSLRIVTLQMACNLFSSPLYPEHILTCSALTTPIINLITSSLLDFEHHNVRIAAASLAFNVATANSEYRMEQKIDLLGGDMQIELAASLLESVKEEKQSPEAMKGFLLAFAFLIYCLPETAATDGRAGGVDEECGGIMDFLEALDAKRTIAEKAELFPHEKLIDEIADVLLVKGKDVAKRDVRLDGS